MNRGPMKLIEALEILKRERPAASPALPVYLACGFTPLHLETFLAAYLQQGCPDRRVTVQHGLFGDLAGNLERLDPRCAAAVAVVIEWPDLDPRLGVRILGGWNGAVLADVLRSARAQLARLAEALGRLSGIPAAVSLPTLPLPPVAHCSPRRFSPFELQLKSELAAFAASLAALDKVRLVGAQQVDLISPPHERFDIKSELLTGFPYSLKHAGRMADLLAWLVRNPVPKKGVITDLDDTLWLGILGEVGVDGIGWGQEAVAHSHGLYQQLLASLAGAGTLIAVVSKNDPRLVEQALARQDLLLPQSSIFPVEAGWGPKSESVARILRAWNVGAEAVVFIDDSPMEIAEVRSAFPDMQCLLFPKGDYAAIWELLQSLRDIFGKDSISEEDRIRLQSLRAGEAFQQQVEAASGAHLEEFLRGAEAEITFAWDKQPDPRALELINKTNQFNLNGGRIAEAAWASYLLDPSTFLLRVAYRDRYGPLGAIAVLAGRFTGGELTVDHWVMSCRAFSRRIEHRCLQGLFARFPVKQLALQFAPTPRNGPLQEFLAHFAGNRPQAAFRLSRDSFVEKCPPLFHRLREPAPS